MSFLHPCLFLFSGSSSGLLVVVVQDQLVLLGFQLPVHEVVGRIV